MFKVACVIPTYGAFDYAADACRSFLEFTPGATCFHLDDASPNWPMDGLLPGELQGIGGRAGRFLSKHFSDNCGLTAVWNYGLQMAFDDVIEHDYVVVTNSDVVFTPGWFHGVRSALDAGCDLVGPVTNAPGTEEAQHARRFDPEFYQVSDASDYLAFLAERLRRFDHKPREGPINGFCMIARTETWRKHMYDAEHVFKPRNDVNSKGQPNPTPLMTLQEYELQARWRKAGLKIGYVPKSYVFHYRAVSRGDKNRRGDWYRKEKGDGET